MYCSEQVARERFIPSGVTQADRQLSDLDQGLVIPEWDYPHMYNLEFLSNGLCHVELLA